MDFSDVLASDRFSHISFTHLWSCQVHSSVTEKWSEDMSTVRPGIRRSPTGYWQISGQFSERVTDILQELKEHRPDILQFLGGYPPVTLQSPELVKYANILQIYWDTWRETVRSPNSVWMITHLRIHQWSLGENNSHVIFF